MPKAEIQLTLRDKMKGSLDAARQNVNRSVNSMQAKINSLQGGSLKAISAIGTGIPGIGKAFAALANPITAATTAMATATGISIKKANEWHIKMAEINVTAGLAKKELKGLSDQLLEVGSRNSVDLNEIPKAFLRIVSAGLNVKQSMEALEPTVRAAKAGFTDMETTAAAGVATMMSSGENINKVYDILFNTVREGNATFNDIARYLPKIIPMARNVGFALNETAGAYASLTTKLSAEQSTTALEGIMRSLSNEKNMSKFKHIGVEVFDIKTGKVKPILEIIKQLEESMKGLTDNQRMIKFGSLGLDDMSKLGFATLIQDVKGLEKTISATVNSQGALDKAYKDSLTPLEQWKIVMNQINVYIIKFGELFLPILSAAGQKVLNFINYWKNLYKESLVFRDFISSLVWVFRTLWDMVTFKIRVIINLFLGGIKLLKDFFYWIGKIILRLSGFSGSFTDLYLKIKPFFLWMKEMIESISDIMSDVFNFKFSDAKDKIKNFKFPNLDQITAQVLLDAKPKSDTSLTNNNSLNGSGLDSSLANPTTPINESSDIIKGGGQAKNLTINIDSFIKNLSSENKEINNMNKRELEHFFTEMFMRVIRSAEREF